MTFKRCFHTVKIHIILSQSSLLIKSGRFVLKMEYFGGWCVKGLHLKILLVNSSGSFLLGNSSSHPPFLENIKRAIKGAWTPSLGCGRSKVPLSSFPPGDLGSFSKAVLSSNSPLLLSSSSPGCSPHLVFPMEQQEYPSPSLLPHCPWKTQSLPPQTPGQMSGKWQCRRKRRRKGHEGEIPEPSSKE